MNKISNEVIENFLQGSDPQQYIVAIEAGYSEPTVTLVINDPETGKRLETHPFKPFLWFKHDITSILYGGNKVKRIEAGRSYGVKLSQLRTSNSEGFSPERLENGYKYMATCNKSYNDLINFFKAGGVDVFNKDFSKNFVMFRADEQFLIQSGKRLFKGMDDYDDVHRFQFDLETTGLFPSKDSVFQIGVRDNKGLEHVLEVKGETLQEKRNEERATIAKFFKIIDFIQPDIITGYNSENFDWPFLFERAERLSIPITDLAITLNRVSKIKRKPATVKFGGETEHYLQTNMYGYNIMDISHAVRRAMAINSEIKSWGLKYITQYSEIAKPNRVYVPGDKINITWKDKDNQYAFNDANGDWYMITDKNPLKEGYVIKKGDYIVQRYLCDDLWETEQIDNIFNQASFLIAKMLPTSFQRSSTMGTAGQWKLIMAAWSYENGLAIPENQTKRDFTGGLSRLLELGFARNVYKLDYAALYPKTQITHKIFPDLDISGVMEGILTYVVDTRDKFKFLTGTEKKTAKKYEALLKEGKDLTPEQKEEYKKLVHDHKALSNLYDKKQLPLKILANSWFGSYGAPYIFNWGDTDSAEETTCRGRQYLRLMVKYFTEVHGFRALVGDSVTFDTPIYLKDVNGFIDIKAISELFNEKSEFLDNEKLRDFEEKDYSVLTRGGWKKIKYVYRHETDKAIHRITTKDSLLNVTEDHSLFQNGIEVKPSSLKRGDKIDINIVSNNIEDRNHIRQHISLSSDVAWLYGFFLGDGSATTGPRKQYYKSRKTGEINVNKGTRSDWKISNTRMDYLVKLQTILSNSFNVKSSIKNHLKSSGVYNLVVHNTEFAKIFTDNFYTNYREKKVPKVILNSNLDCITSFMNGVCASDGYGDTLETCSDIGMKSQTAMSGIAVILNTLKIEYKIKVRSDKENFISFSLKNNNRNNSNFTNKTLKKSDEVWKNEIILNRDVNKYVYDISTEDGTFICGVGGIIAHNTDGFNFAAPDNINDIKYTAKGSHWKTLDDAGKELIGIDAALAEFNETYMEGRMGLDLDDVCSSTINFARKNYANDIGGKIKLVGNSVKSKKMSVYIEEFLGKGIRMLLDGDGHSFINYYYEYVDKIYNYQIPLVKIASKAKIKSNIVDYKKKATMKNKAGNPMPKQAHMELAMKANLDITLGDTLFYINTGTSKSHGDLKTVHLNKMTKKQTDKWIIDNPDMPIPEVKREVQLNCKLIDPKVIEHDFELIKELEMLKKAVTTMQDNDEVDMDSFANIGERIEEINSELYTDEYNVARYLDAFNKKIKPLLVCFNLEVRNSVILDIVKIKDKQTKKITEKLKDRTVFTIAECEMVSGISNKAGDQDSYEDLMRMEDKEIKFWMKVNKLPNNMTQEEWDVLQVDYVERLRVARLEGIQREKDTLDDIFKHLELQELRNVVTESVLPRDAFVIADVGVDDDGVYLMSRKWEVKLCGYDDIFKYRFDAIERDKYYQLTNINNIDNRYELYLEYLTELNFITGETMSISVEEIELNPNTDEVVKSLKKSAEKVILVTEEPKKKKVLSEDDEDEENEFEEDEDGNLTRSDEILQLDDEFDDTFGDIPEGYVVDEIVKEKEKEEEPDEWGF